MKGRSSLNDTSNFVYWESENVHKMRLCCIEERKEWAKEENQGYRNKKVERKKYMIGNDLSTIQSFIVMTTENILT